VNNGRLLIADLGLSKHSVTPNSDNSIANRQGMPQYIEPQCFKNLSYKKDEKSDIYCLGVLFWELSSSVDIGTGQSHSGTGRPSP
jgi:serine/threonine protein kinase